MLGPQLLHTQGSSGSCRGEDGATKRRLLVRRLLSVLALTVVVTGLAAVGLSNEVFAGFQRRATDSLFPAAPDSGKVVVVGFDRDTIADKTLGNPLPRAKVAQLIENLNALGARVIAFDVIYETEQTDAQITGDAAMASAIDSGGNVVLGTKGEPQPVKGSDVLEAPALTGYAPGIASSSFVPGYVQVNSDPTDGVSRSIPMVVQARDGQFVPSLSLAAVMAFRGIGGPLTVRPQGVQIGDRLVPTIEAKSLLLNFSPQLSGTSDLISAKDVIDGTVDRSKIAGKIVFVGAVDSTLGDNKTAPVNKSAGIPGVLLHANAANTILTGNYLESVSNTSTLMWVAILTALIGIAVLVLPLWMSVIFTFVIGFGYLVFAFVRFNQGHVFNFVYPSLTIVLAFVGALGLRYFGETRQRRRVTALFSQYVPETVARRLVDEDKASQAAEGERLEMTVLFCDLRGFTALSESLEPSVVRTMLNHYYDKVTDVVLANSGTLMKYVGDEVFAVWGAPLPDPDHPARALECAMAIQAITPELNRELLELGCPEVSFGIGLNTGEAVAAHFGGGRRRQYDVVGDTVNVGARLCSQAGRGEIILSDQVLERVPDPPPVEPVGPVTLKGVSRELKLWRVVDTSWTNVAESAVVAMGSATASEGATDTRRSQEW
jgi:adenylate cyclase